MVTRFKELTVFSEKNAEIAIAGNQIFANDEANIQARLKYGSYNRLLISNNSAVGIEPFTGQNSLGILIPGASLVIAPEDGIRWELLTVVNLSAAAVVAANSVSIRQATAIPVQ